MKKPNEPISRGQKKPVGRIWEGGLGVPLPAIASSPARSAAFPSSPNGGGDIEFLCGARSQRAASRLFSTPGAVRLLPVAATQVIAGLISRKMTKQTQFRTTSLQSMGCDGFPVRLDGPTQRDLTDRFTGIRGHIELRPGGTEEQKRGNELSDHRTTGAQQWEQRNDQTNPISRNQLAINGLRNPCRLLEARLGERPAQVAFALQAD